MGADVGAIDVYLESGSKRVLAVAVDWPGWCRGGKDEGSALAALLQAAPHYAAVVKAAGLAFAAPTGIAEFQVCDRLTGSTATDMGVPERLLPADAEPLSEDETARSVRLLRACWGAFDRAVAAARGSALRKGPRGGGRELDAIVRHVAEAEAAYAGRTGIKVEWRALTSVADPVAALAASRDKVLEGLAAAAPVGLPPPGPRGGARWPARYFVRRVAYHVVDHTWEIEDRMQSSE